MTEPVQNIFDAIEPVLTRWTMGGAAAPVAPAPWNAAIGARFTRTARSGARAG